MLTSDAMRVQLLGELQEKNLDLDTILRVGETIFENREHLQLYGMGPKQYTELGITFTGRTAIECVNDPDAISIAHSIGHVLKCNSNQDEPVVIDLFAGSGNVLFHVAKQLNSKINIGFENNEIIYSNIKRNFEIINFPATVVNDNFETSIRSINYSPNRPLVVIIDPPWKNGFSFEQGLDLRATYPPIGKIVDSIRKSLVSSTLFCIIKTFEVMNESSVSEVTNRCDICGRYTSSQLKRGMNIGWIICCI